MTCWSKSSRFSRAESGPSIRSRSGQGRAISSEARFAKVTSAGDNMTAPSLEVSQIRSWMKNAPQPSPRRPRGTPLALREHLRRGLRARSGWNLSAELMNPSLPGESWGLQLCSPVLLSPQPNESAVSRRCLSHRSLAEGFGSFFWATAQSRLPRPPLPVG